MSGPVVHLPLDELHALQARDASGNALHATAAAATAPTLVADDTFGSVLQFDGVNDVLTLPAAAVPAGEELSVCLWALGGASLPKSTSVLWAADAAGARTFNVHLPWGHEVVFFDHGNSGGNFDRIERKATPDEYKGSWAHWAFVRETGGTMRIYRNGAEWMSGTGKTRTRSAATTVLLGGPSQNRWPGKLAHLRIYARAVSADEIAGIIEEDRTARSPFRASHPFDVYLHDGNDQEVLYITDAARSKPLHVEITNRSGLAARLTAPATATVSPENHHFALRFRPGTLAFAAPAAPASLLTDAQAALDADLPTGWSGTVVRETDGSAALYLLHGAGIGLAAQEKLSFVLRQARADAGAGARGTRAELRFGQLTLGGSATPVTGRRLAHLNVVNHQGEREIPLRAAFTGNAVVVNNGTTSNNLTLRLSTLLREGQIDFTGPLGRARTRLVLSFDVDADVARAWALGTTSHVGAMSVEAKVQGTATSWEASRDTDSSTPQWNITPTADTSLKPNEWLELNLGGLITGHAAGETAVYLRYENVPGYWDGVLVVPLGKGRLVQKDGKVGIGTANPTESLHTTGHVRVDGGEIKSTAGITLRPDTDGTGDCFVRVMHSNGTTRLLSVSGSGALEMKAANIAQTVNFQHSFPASYGVTSMAGDGLHIQPQNAGVLGVPNADVLMWKAGEVYVNGGLGVTSNLRVNGRVGIGTASPAESLHTTGSVRVDAGEIKSVSGITMRPDIDNTGDGWFRVVRVDGTEMMKIATTTLLNAQVVMMTVNGAITANGLVVSGHISGDTLKISGNISGGSIDSHLKWFRIRHPLHPGRDLVHACLEGPENGVYYRGTARLRDGRATVLLPDYFEALTRPEGRTVQLTARGREPFALSHDGVAEGAFEVFGAKADGEFDWEVRAVRSDVPPLETDLPTG